MKLQSINPHDQSLVGEVDITSPEEIIKIVSLAKAAFVGWKTTPITTRTSYIDKYKALLVEHKDELAILVSKEMGKPLGQSREDIDGEIVFLDYYTTAGVAALADETISKSEKEHFRVVYEPYGVCAVITPWNFPASMFNSGVIPALIAGNVVVVKPTESSTLSQKLMFDLLLKTGLPIGVANIVLGGKDTGKQLVESGVDLVWFTGSTKAGLHVAKKCGEKFIKCILEMGGSTPGIVFADADLDHAVEQLYWARFLNTGQVCSAVKRLFVQKPIFNKFVELYIARLAKAKLGDPLSSTDLGPLVNTTQLDLLKSQVQDAVDKGAKVLVGGSSPTDPELQKGNYYLPTVLTNIKPDMRVMTEEVFGPVLPIVSFKTKEEAIQLANDTEYGLTAEVYTQDYTLAEELASQIDSGVVAVNTDSFYRPMFPIGGYKKSGMGREYGTIGMREFCQVKLIGIFKP